VFERELVDFVLGFKSEDFVVGVLAEVRPVLDFSVELFDFFDGLVDFFVVALIDVLLLGELLPPHIDLFAEAFVDGLQVVEFGKHLFASVLQHFNLLKVAAHRCCWWPDILKRLLSLEQLLP
jgi:hypothetical protein